jgi:hypothetical protein
MARPGELVCLAGELICLARELICLARELICLAGELIWPGGGVNCLAGELAGLFDGDAQAGQGKGQVPTLEPGPIGQNASVLSILLRKLANTSLCREFFEQARVNINVRFPG